MRAKERARARATLEGSKQADEQSQHQHQHQHAAGGLDAKTCSGVPISPRRHDARNTSSFPRHPPIHCSPTRILAALLHACIRVSANFAPAMTLPPDPHACCHGSQLDGARPRPPPRLNAGLRTHDSRSMGAA